MTSQHSEGTEPSPLPPNPIANQQLLQIVELGIASTRRLEGALQRQHSISMAQYRILWEVDAHVSLTPSQLAALLLQETHSVSGLLNRLEDRELVCRLRDRSDRRMVHVTLTTAGEELLLQSSATLTNSGVAILEAWGVAMPTFARAHSNLVELYPHEVQIRNGLRPRAAALASR